jgi:REG-2-like HAD superfamily hydrolase
MKLEQPQAIRTIFFDAGFTLIRPHPSIPEICYNICRKLSLHVDLSQIAQQMEIMEESYFRRTNIDKHTWADEQAITRFWITYYMDLLRPFIQEHDELRLHELAVDINTEFGKHTSWRTYPDVITTLDTLRAQGYSLGIISDWGISLGAILRNLNLTPYFDCLLISATTRHAKPSPMLYERALQRANAIPDYTIHIGDSYINDVIGARSVGITPILLDRKGSLTDKNMDCLLIHSLTDVLDLLEVERLEREHQST